MTAGCTVMMVLAALWPGAAPPAGQPPRRPNLVVILADDLGYSDPGCYGGEIRTPHLDGLAAGGLRFTQFYNTARCWPTRAALLTGYYAQQVRRDTVPGVTSGTRGTRPKWARLLPEMLRPLGYRSYHSGKWHVDGQPLANGFDRSYRLEDAGRYFHPRVHFEDDRELPPVQPGTGYHTTTAIADHGLTYLREHAAKHPAQPFFLYLAFTAPHFPLQARPEDIARYHGRYQRGWEAVRGERWRRIQELGLVRGRLPDVERAVGPPYHFPEALKVLGPGEVNRPLPWSDLNEFQRGFQATKMAIHAAMVDRMDQEIGRVLEQLRAMGAFEDTLIVFLSDNGASAEIMVRDEGHDPAAPPGSAASHLCLGPGWSTVANTPFRRHKTWVHEGGIATPLIIHWPKGIAARGELRHNPGHVIDWVPTFREIAGAPRWDNGDDRPTHVPAPPGRSLVPAFSRDGTVKHDDLWWEHEGNRAIRVGDWKLVAAGRDGPWELYDLATDRTETRDLARQHPETVRELARRWQRRHDEFAAIALQESGDGARSGPGARREAPSGGSGAGSGRRPFPGFDTMGRGSPPSDPASLVEGSRTASLAEGKTMRPEFVTFDSFLKQLQSPGPHEDQERRKKREYLAARYQGMEVVHSFMNDEGEYIDCVKIGTQHGLEGQPAPATPPPFVAMPGSPSATVRGVDPHLAHPRLDRYGHVMQCPPGAIPMRRVTLEELARTGRLEDYFQKAPGGGALPPTRGAP
jgi:arylsulfatase